MSAMTVPTSQPVAPLAARTALDELSKDGAFVRVDSVYRSTEVEPVAGRYHLYVALACPWACGCLAALVSGERLNWREGGTLECLLAAAKNVREEAVVDSAVLFPLSLSSDKLELYTHSF